MSTIHDAGGLSRDVTETRERERGTLHLTKEAKLALPASIVEPTEDIPAAEVRPSVPSPRCGAGRTEMPERSRIPTSAVRFGQRAHRRR